MQKTRMIAGAVIVLLSSLVSIPIIARHLSAQALSVATISILAHSLFGIVDFFRPLIVRNVAEDPKFANYYNLLVPSIFIGTLFSIFLIVFGSVWHTQYDILLFPVAISLVLFCLYVPIWGAMDGNLQMGTAYLIRSLSVASLYGVIALGSLINVSSLSYLGIVIANFLAFIMFWIVGKRYVSVGEFSLSRSYYREAGHFVIQNIFKLINDFGDRIMATAFLPVAMVGLYNIASDSAGRINFPSQILSSYYYPVLCKKPEKAQNFLWVGVGLSFALFIGCFCLYNYGHQIYIHYFGRKMDGIFGIFCALLACFGNYSLSFFGQTVGRSRGFDRDLSISFGLSAILGILACAILAKSFSLSSLIVIAAIFKSSAIAMMFRLLKHYPLPAIAGLLSTVCNLMFVLYMFLGWSAS